MRNEKLRAYNLCPRTMRFAVLVINDFFNWPWSPLKRDVANALADMMLEAADEIEEANSGPGPFGDGGMANHLEEMRRGGR